MLHWLPYAMVRITVFFLAGILIGIYSPLVLPSPWPEFLFLFLLVGYALSYLVLRGNSRLNTVSGIMGLGAITLAGYANLVGHTESSNETHLGRFRGIIDQYAGQIVNDPEERINSTRIQLEVSRVYSSGEWKNCKGKVLLFLPKKMSGMKLRFGDRLMVNGSPSDVPPPGNPGEFDYRQFLRHKNIYHQHFVRAGEIRLIQHDTDPGWMSWSFQLRNKARSIIDQYVTGDRERGITKALVLGVTDGLDNELLSAYSASGAMHVLSVSGLHVGIIYAVIAFFLKPLSRNRWGKWIVALLSLTALWIYALVTGLSPSVLRAVSMFSFVVIARPMGRETNIFNTIAASAFFLLIWDPWLVMSVGFQLSYIAVFGIVYLQGKLYSLWTPEFWLWDKIWQVTCVSLAAQWATFPLGLFYFHQFPVYFLISNLLVIPLSSVILLAGILLIMVSSIAWAAALTGGCLQFLIRLLNETVFFIEGLPGSLIDGVYISAVQCWVLIGILVCLVLLFEKKKFHFATLAFFLTVFFTSSSWMKVEADLKRSEWMVYRIQGCGAMDWMEGGKSRLFTDSTLRQHPEWIRRNILPGHILKGIHRTDTIGATHRGLQYFVRRRVSVIWINDPRARIPRDGRADFLVIGNDGVRSLAEFQQQVRFGMVILDGSNSGFYVNRIVEEARCLGAPVYDVMDHGAFVITL